MWTIFGPVFHHLSHTGTKANVQILKLKLSLFNHHTFRNNFFNYLIHKMLCHSRVTASLVKSIFSIWINFAISCQNSCGKAFSYISKILPRFLKFYVKIQVEDFHLYLSIIRAESHIDFRMQCVIMTLLGWLSLMTF